MQGRGSINPVSEVTVSSLPAVGSIVVGTVSSDLVSETFVPTIYSQYVSLLTTITSASTSTSSNAQSTPVLIVIGPRGIGWAPYNQEAGPSAVPLPTVPTLRPDESNLYRHRFNIRGISAVKCLTHSLYYTRKFLRIYWELNHSQWHSLRSPNHASLIFGVRAATCHYVLRCSSF